jgi:hypothetical protein
MTDSGNTVKSRNAPPKGSAAVNMSGTRCHPAARRDDKPTALDD